MIADIVAISMLSFIPLSPTPLRQRDITQSWALDRLVRLIRSTVFSTAALTSTPPAVNSVSRPLPRRSQSDVQTERRPSFGMKSACYVTPAGNYLCKSCYEYLLHHYLFLFLLCTINILCWNTYIYAIGSVVTSKEYNN